MTFHMENFSPGSEMKTTILNFGRPPPSPCCNVGGGFGSFAEIRPPRNDGVNFVKLGRGGGALRRWSFSSQTPDPLAQVISGPKKLVRPMGRWVQRGSDSPFLSKPCVLIKGPMCDLPNNFACSFFGNHEAKAEVSETCVIL